MDVTIVGVGQFGSALAKIYEGQGARVHFLRRKTKISPALIKNLRRSVTFLCVPTQQIPELMFQRGALLSESQALVSTAKGIIQATSQTPGEYLKSSSFDLPPVLILSGPSFASELRRGQPTALVLAGYNSKAVHQFSKSLSTHQLRLYKSDDPIGVELCGALKNVYAIAAGMAEGLGFGDNTNASLTTRALAEMSRIGKAYGGHTETFFGLAGAGDLFLTCSSHQSRNFRFGLGLAKKMKRDVLVHRLGTVEGLWTAAVAKHLCDKKKIRAPIISAMVQILEGKWSAEKALRVLMAGKVRHEFE